VTNLQLMIFGALIVFFLILEPNGLARLRAIGDETLRLWAFPHRGEKPCSGTAGSLEDPRLAPQGRRR